MLFILEQSKGWEIVIKWGKELNIYIHYLQSKLLH